MSLIVFKCVIVCSMGASAIIVALVEVSKAFTSELVFLVDIALVNVEVSSFDEIEVVVVQLYNMFPAVFASVTLMIEKVLCSVL